MKDKITYQINPTISADELYDFYSNNSICEEGYGKEIATRVISFTSLIVGAYHNENLIGITRSMFDGVTAELVEFCLAIDYQGKNLEYDNGSIIEKDEYGIAAELGKNTVRELIDMGAYFVSGIAFEEVEKDIFINVGFKRNDGHINYTIDQRPYIPKEKQSNFI